MNTYFLRRTFSGYEEFEVEADTEDEAIAAVENGWEPEYKEEDDWGDVEVIEVQYGEVEFEVDVKFYVLVKGDELSDNPTDDARKKIADILNTVADIGSFEITAAVEA